MLSFYLQHIGIAHVEFNERLFSILEFTDDDYFAELEALVVLLGPKECLLPTIDGDVNILFKFLL